MDDSFRLDARNTKKKVAPVKTTKDLTPPVKNVEGEVEEEIVFCPTCGSGDTYLPVTGDLLGNVAPGWRCIKCYPPKTRTLFDYLSRIRGKNYAKRVVKEDPGFTKELEDKT